jgi:hypothetical protein
LTIVRAVFSQKFALEAISAVFRENRNSAVLAFAVNTNQVEQSNANAAFAFALFFTLS